MAHFLRRSNSCVVLPQRLDKTLGYKVMCLMPGLSTTDVRVGALLLDCFNAKTGRCDPSLAYSARMLAISKRTVIRANQRLEKLGLFEKARHGGNWNCNAYQPVWSKFRELEAAWMVKKSRSLVTRVSPVQGQAGHLSGDVAATQNPLNNHFKKANLSTPANLGRSVKPELPRIVPRQSSSVSSTEARRNQAERRWNDDLMATYGENQIALARILEALDGKIQADATDAESNRRGAGLKLIVEATEAALLTASAVHK